MKRTTISLPDDLAAAMEREAGRLRVSVSQVAREGIEMRLGRWAPRGRGPAVAGGGGRGPPAHGRGGGPRHSGGWAPDGGGW
ncbi:MAG: ribbon-helix-helix domain-containing protein, partial [Chloroflexi bacterium]|nr:ribbon-helix-helix domain-containing protein [Chloroflexota bacterium]